jgi:S-sulfosulfanyl-L-cysteine sulfohydrolase
VLFCDCGDTIHGTYPILKTQGQALIPILNSLSIDAMMVHWEFAYGPAVFKLRAAEFSYPMLAINVYD